MPHVPPQPNRSPQTATRLTQRMAYDRLRDLPRLMPFWPHELENVNPERHHALLQRLRRALREERQRGLAGHWTYDLARHAALYRALQAEEKLVAPPRPTWSPPPFTSQRSASSGLDPALRPRRLSNIRPPSVAHQHHDGD